MDKETHKKLTKNFPKSLVKRKHQKGSIYHKIHHIYTKRLVDVVGGKYNFTYDSIRDKNNAVVGAKCTLEIEDLGTVQEIGDVDKHTIESNITESEILKLAVSDGIKRCCMLWYRTRTMDRRNNRGRTLRRCSATSSRTTLKQVAQESTKPPSSITEGQLKEMVFSMCNEDKDFAKKCYDTKYD